MKNIRLVSLTQRDFKGGTFTLVADGKNVDVFGANATGKTRIADAFSWLMFDKDSLGRSDFEIKNLNASGEAEHGLEHSVEGVLMVDDSSVALKKVYKEIWTKKRGSATSTFTGNTTDYFIDGVPVQKKDYQARIAEIAGDESSFRLLTSPTAFPALHWTKQREMLLSVCGDLSDADVIATDAKLSGLPDILGKRKLDDHKKVIAARRGEINKELTALPVRIDEVRRGLPDVSGLDRKALIKEIGVLETEINARKLSLQGVDTGGAIADLSKRLAVIDSDIQKMERSHYDETIKTANRLSEQAAEAETKLGSYRRRIDSINSEIKPKTGRLESLERVDLPNMRTTWQDIEDEAFQDTTADSCAACGQTLPAESVQAAREKALAAFNTDKASRLTAITARGKMLADERDRLQSEVEALRKERDTVAAGIPMAIACVDRDDHLLADLEGLVGLPAVEVEAEKQLKTLTEDRDLVKKQAQDYSLIPDHAALMAKKSEIEVLMLSEKVGRTQDTEPIKEAIRSLESQQATAKTDADKFISREKGETRIEELKDQEKTLAAEFERLESELYLCEQFVRTKVSLLTDRINSRFEIARFKLFDQQVNGGISECCEITVNGIPYGGGLNNAARINAGLDVCRTLSEHFGIQAPIFVDNAESVCELIAMKSQVIRLVVSEKDKVLRVEVKA